MNANERELDYCFADSLPEPGGTFKVAPGIHWVRMPLPFALDHINTWLIEDESIAGGIGSEAGGTPAWTMIDCGIASDEIKGYWETIFDDTLRDKPIHRVLCTHMHPDHFGLADWVCEGGERARWKARLWMTLGEYAVGRLFATTDTGSGAGGAQAALHMKQHGFADTLALEQIAHKAAYYPRLVPSVPAQFQRMIEGDTVRMGGHGWRVIIGYGHSPEHAALYAPNLNVLIAGDMVLPRISTNVSVFDLEPEGDPLGGFLASLHRYDDLPADTLVLPSHGKPFRGLPIRLRQLRDHHAARLQEVVAACAQTSRSAADIVPTMFPRALDTHQMTFALGEALAHLNYLWHRNILERVKGDDDVYRFAPGSASASAASVLLSALL